MNTYQDMDDIWGEIVKLKEEALELSHGKLKNAIKSVFYQIPFFCCPNLLVDKKCQKDISRYIYCEDTKTPAFSGDYGSTPSKWQEKHFIIKQAIAILHDIKRDEIKRK